MRYAMVKTQPRLLFNRRIAIPRVQRWRLAWRGFYSEYIEEHSFEHALKSKSIQEMVFMVPMSTNPIYPCLSK